MQQTKLQILRYCRDSSVGTATCHSLDCPGIESLWVRTFPHPSRPPLTLTPASVPLAPGLLPGSKAPDAWGLLPTPDLGPNLKKVYSHTSTSSLWALIVCSMVTFVSIHAGTQSQNPIVCHSLSIALQNVSSALSPHTRKRAPPTGHILMRLEIYNFC